ADAISSMGSVVSLILVLSGTLVARATTSQFGACLNNLRQIDAAKEQLAVEKKLDGSAVIEAAAIAPYIKGGFPTCPGGGVYRIGSLQEAPTCSIAEHSEAELARRRDRMNRRISVIAIVGTVGFVVVTWLIVGTSVVYLRDRRRRKGARPDSPA
ncbi:MAG TPA: hypothetical protein VM680_14350, partial [Verrucomicrobiae bacterium]|nr:hypothetical protein [Verrucomicrobiae bacterium]